MGKNMKTILKLFKALFLSLVGKDTKADKKLPKDTFNELIQGKCNSNCENCVCQVNK